MWTSLQEITLGNSALDNRYLSKNISAKIDNYSIPPKKSSFTATLYPSLSSLQRKHSLEGGEKKKEKQSKYLLYRNPTFLLSLLSAGPMSKSQIQQKAVDFLTFS